MQYHWYPGHMSKAKRQMQEDLKLIDVLVELVDARIPYSSKNPDIEKMAQGKSRVLLLNKYDMADPAACDKWSEYYESKGYFVVKLNSRTGSGVNKVKDVIMKACAEKIERDRKKGILNRPVRAMICGIPNVGKSTFINSFAGKACTKTGNKPGVTKGKQWIRLNKNVELLDTPGILWPKFEDEIIGRKLAYIGSINDNILDSIDMAAGLIGYVYSHYNDNLKAYYGCDFTDDNHKNIELIAEKRGCLGKGGSLDIERAARLFIDDFRSVKLGRISLEIPEDIMES